MIWPFRKSEQKPSPNCLSSAIAALSHETNRSKVLSADLTEAARIAGAKADNITSLLDELLTKPTRAEPRGRK